MEDCLFYELTKDDFWLVPNNYAPKVLYYSHIPGMIVALLLIFLFVKNYKKKPLSIISILLLSAFFILSLVDLLTWNIVNMHWISFIWTIFYYIGPSTFILAYYLLHVFIWQKDFYFQQKLLLLSLLLPELIFALSRHGVAFFDAHACVIKETDWFSAYFYLVCIVLVLAAIYDYYCFSKKETPISKKKSLLVWAFGLFGLIYLGFDLVSTYLVNNGFTNNFVLDTYAYFSIPIFFAFWVYLIVKTNEFGFRLQETKVMFAVLFIVVGALILFIKNTDDRIMIIITWLITLVLGMIMIEKIKQGEEQKRSKLELLNRELKKLDQTKDEFITLASHQLRSPLTVIKGVSSLMVSGKINDFSKIEQQRFHEAAWNKCRKLEIIIADILNAAKFSNKKVDFMNTRTEWIDLRILMEKIVADFGYEIEEKGLIFEMEPEGIMAPRVFGQIRYLMEALTNLIHNAIKYTPTWQDEKAGVRGKIWVDVRQDPKQPQYVNVVIKDTGMGIPENDVPHLFDKFFRAENARMSQTEGNGLGLYIVKEIIKGHGGKIQVKSQVGKGTTMVVSVLIDPMSKANI